MGNKNLCITRTRKAKGSGIFLIFFASSRFRVEIAVKAFGLKPSHATPQRKRQILRFPFFWFSSRRRVVA
jgi:hypothetical protein